MRKLLIFTLSIGLIFGVIFYLFFRQGAYWSGTGRFRIILGDENGSVTYLLMDQKRNEMDVYPLDPNLQIEAAHGLGSWKVKSLWKLGIQENRGGGAMLSESLIRGYGLPVEAYLNYSGPVEAFNLARHLLFTRDSDLLFRDRLTLTWYALHAHLTDEDALSTASILLSAEELNKVTDGIVTIAKTDSVKDSQVKAVSVLVANLGGKVLDFSTLEDNPSQYCSVSGNSVFAQKLSQILSCSFSKVETDTTHINLGEAFTKTF